MSTFEACDMLISQYMAFGDVCIESWHDGHHVKKIITSVS
jgi:hypothetical protein